MAKIPKINKNLYLFTVMPRIQPPGFYLFLEVESGGSIRGGFNRGVFNKFRPEGAKFFTFLAKSMHFYAVQ